MSHVRALTLVVIIFFSAGYPLAFGAQNEPDYANHPMYSKYQFNDGETKVLNFGTQPMAVPVGVIGATMGRDRLLRAALKERGWEFRSHAFLKGLDSNFFFQRGDLDIAVAGDWPTITLAATHDLRVVGLGKQGFSSIISKGLLQMTDLKGKRIASPPGSTAHYGLLMGLDSVGLKESDVTIIPLEINEMTEALSQGKVDAFASWDPISTNALKTHPEFTMVQRFLNNSYIYLSADLVRKNPEIAEIATAAYVRSLRWLRYSRENLMQAVDWTIKDAERMLGKPSTLSAEEIARLTTDDLLKIASTPVVPRQDLAEHGSIRRAFFFLQAQGKIAATVPWEKIEQSFDQTLTTKILIDPAKYQTLSFDYDQ